MKFGHSADWHFTGYSQDKIDLSSKLPERLSWSYNAAQEMISELLSNYIKTLIISGDSLHNKSIIYTIAQSLLLDIFRNNRDMDFIVLDGNHDKDSKSEIQTSALKSIDNEPNVFRVQGDYEFIDNGKILLVPFSSKMIDIIKEKEADYLISHFGLSEGMLNSGLSIKSNIGLKDLRGKYKTVLLGHYHKPQEIIEESLRVYYVGSIIQRDWGEKGEEKRYLVVDTDNDKIESFPTKGYKKYCQFELNENNYEEVIKEANEMKKLGNFVRLDKVSENVKFDNLSEDILVIDNIEKDITNRGITNAMSMNDKMIKYLEIMETPKEEHEEYLKEGISIIEACSELINNGE